MTYVREAIYQDGVLKLDEPLPLKDQERVRVTIKSSHSVLDIAPVSLGSIIDLNPGDGDLLAEMLDDET